MWYDQTLAISTVKVRGDPAQAVKFTKGVKTNWQLLGTDLINWEQHWGSITLGLSSAGESISGATTYQSYPAIGVKNCEAPVVYLLL